MNDFNGRHHSTQHCVCSDVCVGLVGPRPEQVEQLVEVFIVHKFISLSSLVVSLKLRTDHVTM